MHVIRQRRSIRQYSGHPVPDAVLLHLLDAARWAPSAHNRQPWRFAVVKSSAMKASLAGAMGAQLRRDLETDGVPEAAITADVQRSAARITGAAAAIVLCLTMADMDRYPDPRRQQHEHIMAVQSVAMAGQNLLLAAHDVGLGAVWMCAPLFTPDVVQHVLNLPKDWHPQGLITLGYPAQQRERSRRPTEESVVWR